MGSARALQGLAIAACLTGCAIDDLDYDGFVGDEDCDPENALVYPGAPDEPGDGIDADCDGEDPSYTFVGQWKIIDFVAYYSTIEALVPDSTSGVLTIDDDYVVSLEAKGALDPSLAGVALDLDFVYAGSASPAPGFGRLSIYLDGELDAVVYQEDSEAELDCTVLDEIMDCQGTVKALDTTLRTEATFEPL